MTELLFRIPFMAVKTTAKCNAIHTNQIFKVFWLLLIESYFNQFYLTSIKQKKKTKLNGLKKG